MRRAGAVNNLHGLLHGRASLVAAYANCSCALDKGLVARQLSRSYSHDGGLHAGHGHNARYRCSTNARKGAMDAQLRYHAPPARHLLRV